MDFRLFSLLSLHQMVCVIWFSLHLVQVSTQFCTAWRSSSDLRYPFTRFVQKRKKCGLSIHAKYFPHKNSKMKEFFFNCNVETEHSEKLNRKYSYSIRPTEPLQHVPWKHLSFFQFILVYVSVLGPVFLYSSSRKTSEL